MKKQAGFTAVEMLTVIVVVAGLAGWVMNIIAIIHDCCTPLTGLVVARIIGVFMFPVGAVLGYF